jgi:hypothetical protein
LDLKAWITGWESDYNQTFAKPLEEANSIVVITADNSAKRALPGPKNWEKPPMQTLSEFLKMLPAVALRGLVTEAPSVLISLYPNVNEFKKIFLFNY